MRKKGSRNNGYFFRTGRGWFTKDGTRFVPLTDEQGIRLREKEIPEAIIKGSYARWRLGRQKLPKNAQDCQVGEVCGAYIDSLRNGELTDEIKRRLYISYRRR